MRAVQVQRPPERRWRRLRRRWPPLDKLDAVSFLFWALAHCCRFFCSHKDEEEEEVEEEEEEGGGRREKKKYDRSCVLMTGKKPQQNAGMNK